MTDSTAATRPEVLACRSTADFLAALPRLAGFTAVDSLFVVLFSGSRAGQAIRIDLPETEDPDASIHLLGFICDAVQAHRLRSDAPAPQRAADAPAIVISSSRTFADAGGPPWPRLARRIERRLRREGIGVRELCCIAPDGWASYLDPRSEPRPLAEISASPVAAPEDVPDIVALGRVPRPDPKRSTAVATRLGELAPYEFPGSELPPPAGSELGWICETAAVTRELLRRDRELSPRMTARLVRSTAHPGRWLVLALGVLTRPEFPLELAREMPAGRLENVPVDLDVDTGDAAPIHRPGPGWSIRLILESVCPDFTQQDRLPGVRDRLLTALSETPPELRAGLYAFSAWVWWLSGCQSVAFRHARAALDADPANGLNADPANGLARMVHRLARTHLYARALAPPRAAARSRPPPTPLVEQLQRDRHGITPRLH